MGSILNEIGQDARQAAESMPQDNVNVGIYICKPVNDVMKEAAEKPVPRQLFPHLWYEGEICCLFADSNLGKSILAVQIANDIADKGDIVLYFDFELTDKQFQLRYTTADGQMYKFSPNLYRVEVNVDEIDCENNFEEELMSGLEEAIVRYNCRVAIIDNLSWMCNASEKGDAAGILMSRFIILKKKYNLSLLVISHTPKRDTSKPITRNDLAGSSKLFNFFDSVFAIGRSAKDENLRYIKQIKCRHEEIFFGSDNVIVGYIDSEEVGIPSFKTIGWAPERDHLREPTEPDRDGIKSTVLELSRQGKSCREIATQTGISRSTVSRILKNAKDKS